MRNPKYVEKAVYELVAVTGWRPWFARNIVVWRVARKLPISVSKTV